MINSIFSEIAKFTSTVKFGNNFICSICNKITFIQSSAFVGLFKNVSTLVTIIQVVAGFVNVARERSSNLYNVRSEENMKRSAVPPSLLFKL